MTDNEARIEQLKADYEYQLRGLKIARDVWKHIAKEREREIAELRSFIPDAMRAIPPVEVRGMQ